MSRPAQSSNFYAIPPKLFFNRREVVALTGLSLRFVDSLIANGTIRAKRVGDRVLITRSELLRFAEASDDAEGVRRAMPKKRKPQALRRNKANGNKPRLPHKKATSTARDRSLHALRDMRHGVPFSQALRDNRVSRRTAKKHLGAALFQNRPGGRIRATRSDRLVRYLQLPGHNGPIEVTVRGSKAATQAAKYKAAINRFLRGNLSALLPWHGKKIGGVKLITDGPTLKAQAQNDLLPYSLYRSLSGGAS